MFVSIPVLCSRLRQLLLKGLSSYVLHYYLGHYESLLWRSIAVFGVI